MKRLFALFFSLIAIQAIAQNPGQNFDPPKTNKPSSDDLSNITSQMFALATRVENFHAKNTECADVEVYLKAAQYVTKHEEYFDAKYGEKIKTVLVAGLRRAIEFKGKDSPWMVPSGKPVIFAYKSFIDGSIQPYKVTFPTNFEPKSNFRLDVNLHGRDASLTEVKFIHAVETAKPGKAPSGVVIDVYGRGNNAYRWAGEADVWEAISDFGKRCGVALAAPGITHEARPFILRGFSMGGAGTWHMGLHYPFRFTAIGPGAGFSSTRGYYKGLVEPVPEYIDRCLKIYDAVEYAENSFHVPVVAYAGDKDPQIQATKNIQERLKQYPKVPPITQIVGVGLEHKMPPEYMAKAEAEYQKHIEVGKQFPEKIRFVTYTLKYPEAGWVRLEKLTKHYDRTLVEGEWTKDKITLKTTNVDTLVVEAEGRKLPPKIVVNGVTYEAPEGGNDFARIAVNKSQSKLTKNPSVMGPIDDAFARKSFVVVKPTNKGIDAERDVWLQGEYDSFDKLWDKYFRGKLPTAEATKVTLELKKTLVLFGDPKSNPLIAELLPHLPIRWTETELVVNGNKYDAKKDVPILIYPHPKHPTEYVVINSGHTFNEEDLKGTNAALYPRLGDYAVVKPTAPAKGKRNYNIQEAGLFDENWQFGKK